ncbi:MAG: tetratricopeptide repeat protein [Paludibacteraceae bacterium]|nr:tetratricopeptide repeat protein [Paludibacteraceae bacterium]
MYILIGFVFSTAVTFAQDYQTAFTELQQQFEQRSPATINHLKQYLKDYPYTPYSDEILLMEGVLQTEKGKYKQAIKLFNQVKSKNLSRQTQPMWYFYMGYAYIQQQEYDQALPLFLTLTKHQTLYTPHAHYYAGYCYYCKQDFPHAMAEFLAVESLGGYKQIAPYYIVQIYYAQHEYDQIYDRAEKLLTDFPDNLHNDELHRMLGEIYYQDSAYNEAINHLQTYRTLRLEQKQEPLRNDLYLLGMANYSAGYYANAIDYLKEVKEQQDSISENTYLHLGHSYLRVGDEEKAKLSYAAAMRFKINDQLREEAMYNYVQITYLQGSALGENITAFQDFLTEYPNTKYTNKVYALMADMYLTSKNYQAAYEALSEIQHPDAKMQETKQYLRYQLGMDAFLQGKMQDAIEWMTQVINNDKKTSQYKTEAYYVRAESQYRMHQYAACLEDIKQYESQSNVANSPNQVPAMYLKGYALFNQQQMKDAEYTFRQYLAKADNQTTTYADASNRLGDCLFYSRQFDDAIATYQQVVEHNTTGVDYALFQQGYAQGLLHRYPNKIQTMQTLETRFPHSDYADDALYEQARAHLQLDQYNEAIKAYTQLTTDYPNSNKAAKSALEIGMTYRTLKQYDSAIQAYKNTIQRYAGSEEAYAALEGLEQVFVETNRISDYLAYTKTLDKVNMQAATSEDSLVYVTAELQYMMGNYEQAAAGLTTYLTSFCPGGRYCMIAQYYAANSYYRLKQYDNAIDQYSALADMAGNPYMEEACMRVAELSYDKGEYRTASYYFQRMEEIASSSAMRTTAQLGVLRCSHLLGDKATTIEAANRLLEEQSIADDIRKEALYYRAKAHLEDNQFGLAVVDLTPLAKEVRTAMGAEAKYQLANCYFQLGSIDMAEEEIMSFTKMQTSQQYWLAKSLILLSDINVARNDLFQAKQYLLALQSSYRQEDDIQSIITQKLSAIAELDSNTTEENTL